MRPLEVTEAYSILAPDAIFRVEAARWVHQARTFLDAAVAVEGGTGDDIVIAVAPVVGGVPTRVTVQTLPIAECPEVMVAARRGVDAIGGAGMDVLVARAQRIVQVALAVEGDPRAPLLVAALLASVLLGPIVPPDEVTIYGVRGARVRLEKLGWPYSPL